jgi:hypothetical protein
MLKVVEDAKKDTTSGKMVNWYVSFYYVVRTRADFQEWGYYGLVVYPAPPAWDLLRKSRG